MRLAVIENAGYEGESIRGEFTSWRDAQAFIDSHYEDDEFESLHVDIAHWDVEGSFWSYDH